LGVSGEAGAVVVADESHFVRLFDVRDGARKWRLESHAGPAGVAAFSPDGQVMAAGGGDNLVKIWRTSDGQLIAKLDVPECRGLAFSPDGKILAARAAPGRGARSQLYLWTRDWRMMNRITTDPSLSVMTNLRYSPDGRYLAYGSSEVHVMDLLDYHVQKLEQRQLSVVTSVQFSGDGRWFFSGSLDHRESLESRLAANPLPLARTAGARVL
jgi:WD40 repeat protein